MIPAYLHLIDDSRNRLFCIRKVEEWNSGGDKEQILKEVLKRGEIRFAAYLKKLGG